MKLFVCYAYKDRADLDTLLERLRPLEREGLVEAWHDRLIAVGEEWRDAINRALGGCDAGIFLLSPAFRDSDFINSVEQKELLRRYSAKQIDVVPILLRSFVPSGSGFEDIQPLPGFNQFVHHTSADPIAEGERWTLIEKAIRAKAEAHRVRPKVVDMPYPGMRSFEVSQAKFFVAREQEAEALAKRLEGERRLLVLFGDSGSGKSSLAKAGVVPELLRRPGADRECVVIFKPNGAGSRDPFLSLAIKLCRCLGDAPPDEPDLAKALRDNPECIAAYVAMALRSRDPRAEFLVVVDQFEEIFTVVEEASREGFVCLIDLLVEQPRVRVVLTVRHDFYPAMDRYPALVRRLNQDTSQRVSPLGAESFSAIIREPAQRAGFTFEAGLVERLLTDARQLGNERAVVPLLAYALQSLVEPVSERIRRGDALLPHERVLTHRRYDEFGGVLGAIAAAAGRAVAGLEDEEVVLGRLAKHLVTITPDQLPARLSARRSDFGDEHAVGDLVERLVQQRLLVATDATVEVAHEALFDAWPALRDWIARHKDDLHLRARLQLDAEHWQAKGRHRTLLWPHERLQPLYAALARLGESPRQLAEPMRTFALPEAERLRDEINNPDTDHERRDWIGRRWCEIGDPRRGVGLRGDGLPDLEWCDVPGGKVKLAAVEGVFEVQPFRIAKYLLTRSQYQPFLGAGGYDNDAWWAGLTRPSPRWNPSGAGASYPVGLVSWHEAMAYCRWLTARLRAAGEILNSEEIRLATEWEWQQAACSGDASRLYPWEGKFDSARCNTDESGLMRMTAVGLYPAGAADGGQGALDMAGNAWEWCANRYDKPRAEILDGDSHAPRALRGGSWINDLESARVTFRLRSHADLRYVNIGFRVSRVSLASPIAKR